MQLGIIEVDLRVKLRVRLSKADASSTLGDAEWLNEVIGKALLQEHSESICVINDVTCHA